MGVFFNDPDVDLDEISWYNRLAEAILLSLARDEGLIYIDEKLNTRSCYVELHRKGELISYFKFKVNIDYLFKATQLYQMVETI